MKAYKPNFFHINYIFLKFCGVWPPDNDTTLKYKIYKIYQSAVLLILVVFGTYSFSKGIMDSVSDLTTLIEISNIGATIFLTEIKIVFWLKCSRHLKNIMNTLENNEFRYEKIDSFDPETIIRDTRRTGQIYTVVLFAFGELTIAFGYITVSSLSFWYYLNGRSISNVSIFQTFPYPLHMPFESDTAIKYFLACILQYLLLHFAATGLVCVDALFMNLLNIIGAQMLILQGAFRTLRKRCMKKIIGPALASDSIHNSDELEKLMLLEMKKCTKHLQMLFR